MDMYVIYNTHSPLVWMTTPFVVVYRVLYIFDIFVSLLHGHVDDVEYHRPLRDKSSPLAQIPVGPNTYTNSRYERQVKIDYMP